ncbi:MAG: MtrB/PioB family outer membrane beta-barrel protein, partial [Shewanella sp.]
MRFSLNLLTLALLTACGSSVAADFGVANANTSRVKDGAYQCKNCVVASGVNGVVTATAGYIDSSNKHAGNAFGTDDDGANASLSGDARYQNGAGYRSQVQAHQLGLDNGFATLSTGRLGQYQLDMDYQSITTYQAGAAQSNLWHNDGLLVPSPYGRVFDLALERQRAGIGLDYDFGDIAALVDISTFVRYDREEKTGTKGASLLAQRPMNFGLPVDESTDKLSAGAVMSGANWLSELSYHGSQYSSHINNISLPYASDVYAATPDNQAHQLALSGQYRLDTSVVNGRVVAGRMVQDDALIQMSGNPLQNWDGQVDTLDAKLAATSMLTNRWRVGGSLDYSKRD